MTMYAYGGDPTGLSGKYHYGSGALGIRGDAIPSTGTQGAAYMYASLSLPTDAAKEYYGVITSIPAGLTITAAEPSDFSASAANGSYVVPFDLYEFGVLLGSSSFTLNFGTVVTLTGASCSQSATSGAGSVTVVPAAPGTVNLIGSNCSQSATTSAGAVTVTPAGAGTVNLTGAGAVQQGQCSSGMITVIPRVPGVINLAGADCSQSATVSTGACTNRIYARSPAGQGYKPRHTVTSVRPAAIQRNDR